MIPSNLLFNNVEPFSKKLEEKSVDQKFAEYAKTILQSDLSGIPDSSSAKRLRVRSENYLLQDFSVDLLANAKIYTGTRARLDYLFSKATFDKPLTIEFDNAFFFS